jgi:hypothetical protein
MRRIASPLNVVGLVLVLCLHAAPALAQATRTWVSGVGDDANPCSRTAPCKTFAGAIAKTAIGGEIDVLDPGGFGAVTITKSISIVSTTEGGVLVSGTNGIVVEVGAADTVVLEGLDFEGLNSNSSLSGVLVSGALGGGRTIIRKCSIRNFTSGVTVTGGARASVIDSLLVNNKTGVNVQNSSVGIVQHTTIDLSTTTATQIDSTSELLLNGATLSGSPSSIVNNGGIVISYGNNVIRNAGSPTVTLVLQ